MLALFIIGIIVIAVGVVVASSLKKSRQASASPIVLTCSVALGLILMVVSCVRTVPTGHTGIVTTFGKVENTTYEAGVHIVLPWKTVINMDNRNQKASLDLLCFSSDIQEVSVVYTLNYQIEKSNAQTIYRTIGRDYYSTVILPRVEEAVKSVMAKYTAETLLSTRAELSNQIKSILVEKLADYNIEVIDTSLENLDFSDVFTDAVEAKQVAEQKSKQAEIEQEQALMEAEYKAKIAQTEANAAAAVAKIAAQADLDVVKIQADAAEYAGQKDAAVIEQLKEVFSVNPEEATKEDVENLLMYYYIQKWSGNLPTTYFGTEELFKMLTGALNSMEGTAPEVDVPVEPVAPETPVVPEIPDVSVE